MTTSPEARMFDQWARSTAPGRWPWQSSLWWGETGRGRPHAIVLLAPDRERLTRVLTKWPERPILVAESLDPELPTADALRILPRLVPPVVYPLATGADVFGVTERLHLHERPRLVVVGGQDEGAATTRVLQLGRRVLGAGGELVWLDALDVRNRLAPVVHQLRLSEQVIFAPPLSRPDVAALLKSADLVVVPSETGADPVTLSDVLAAGCPAVAAYSAHNQAILGPGALWIYDMSEDAWVQGVRQGLSQELIREEIIRRAQELAAPWEASMAAPIWEEMLAKVSKGAISKG
ncbi:hypothetical protein TPY_0116 [Sulfobacillus acidophilus TPY]|uniref:Glycosyl transferase group 1 n=1 Tax=Sulfobacillus acidophilus (strain ATCC 700253 / DSM 10332 / NAL) TaxID=679936 RepID=G8TVP0_SULAD|nr:hypothetical protein TPY_0116 [Sulfobacillus acidophilus TPY]AEW03679.1 glycosyl transferase group 1 [Sulfobacillus acidophilus DSM 10332]